MIRRYRWGVTAGVGQGRGCALRAWRKVVKVSGGKVRWGLVGAFESRMDMWVGRWAISTQASPCPPPE
jgi:hypothetical protein